MKGLVEIYSGDELIHRGSNKIYPVFIDKIVSWIGSDPSYADAPTPPLYCGIGMGNTADPSTLKSSLEYEIFRKSLTGVVVEPVGFRTRLVTNFDGQEACIDWGEIALFDSDWTTESVCRFEGLQISAANDSGVGTTALNDIYDGVVYIERGTLVEGMGSWACELPYTTDVAARNLICRSSLTAPIYTPSDSIISVDANNLYFQFFIMPSDVSIGTLSIDLYNDMNALTGFHWEAELTNLTANTWNLIRNTFAEGTGSGTISTFYGMKLSVSNFPLPGIFFVDDARVVVNDPANRLLARTVIDPTLGKAPNENLSVHWIIDPVSYTI